jgi:hypothetical protein
MNEVDADGAVVKEVASASLTITVANYSVDTEAELTAALSAASAGSTTINVTADITLSSDATIPVGKTVTVTTGKKLIVAEGKTLTVSGVLVGSVTGVVSPSENWGSVKYDAVGIDLVLDNVDVLTFGNNSVTFTAGHLSIGEGTTDKTLEIPVAVTWTFPTNYEVTVGAKGTLIAKGTLAVNGTVDVLAGGHLAISSTTGVAEGSTDNVGLLDIQSSGTVNVYGILSSPAGYVNIAGTLNFGNGNNGTTGVVALNVPGVTISGSGKIAYTTTHTDNTKQWARLGLLDSSTSPDSRIGGGLWKTFGSVSESFTAASLFTTAWKDANGKLTDAAATTMGYTQ